MASKHFQTNENNWINVNRSNNQRLNVDNYDSNHQLTIIDQETLSNLMDNILEVSSDFKPENSGGKLPRSNEYSQVSTPAVKSISSNSSDKVGKEDTEIQGEELMWYWSSRPEINNCSKWISTISQYNDTQQQQLLQGSSLLHNESSIVQNDSACAISTASDNNSSNNNNNRAKIYNSKVISKSLWHIILTHACSFILGAATMYILLKRYVEPLSNDYVE